jgi:Uma2 family endonuclease
MHMPNLRRQWTVDDLDDLPDDGNRYEIIDGELLVTPAPSWPHQRAILLLARRLEDYLSAQPVGEVLIAPADVPFSRVRLVQPDVFVIPFVNGRRAQKFEEVGRLLLAAEVLSPSTGRVDRVEKRVVYREEGVAEYWIVDLDARVFERSTPTDARVDIFADQLEWMPSGAAAPFVMDVAEYFAAVLDD